MQYIFEKQVAWGDMDALGHVNNVVYFKYLEEARFNLLAGLGILGFDPSHPQVPVLAYIDCQFIRPVIFPDTLTIKKQISNIGSTSIQIQSEIFSKKQQQRVLTSKSVVVMTDSKTGRKVPLSAAFREKAKQYFQK